MAKSSVAKRIAGGGAALAAVAALTAPSIANAEGPFGSLGSLGSAGAEEPHEPASDPGYHGNVIHRSHTVTLPGRSEYTDIPVTCADGEYADGEDIGVGTDYVATGGGHAALNDYVHVGISRPLTGLNGDYETYNGKGWLVQAQNNWSNDVEVTAYVVCILAPNDNPAD